MMGDSREKTLEELIVDLCTLLVRDKLAQQSTNGTFKLSKEYVTYQNIQQLLQSPDAVQNKMGVTMLRSIQPLGEIDIEYSGSGDSGGIDHWHSDTFSGVPGSNDVLRSISYRIVNAKIDYDWYNNEGGRGEVTVDLDKKTVDIKGWQYYTQEETAQEEILDLKNDIP